MDGIIIIDKPINYTSRDIVNIVAKKFNTRKVGHAGTLDPLATGILVIAINKGTKILEFLSYDDKEYIAEVKCGIKTDTLDTDGDVLEENNDYKLERETLVRVLKSFIGKYMQEVPKYSAVKVNGKRLYEYARKNIDIKLPRKEVEIKKIELLDISNNGFKFKVKVSKGTYIRSLIRDISKKLNILCTMSNLRRINEGIFDVSISNTLDDINNNSFKLVSLKDALINYRQIEVNEELYRKISNGNKIKNIWDITNIVVFTHKNSAIGIYEDFEGILKARKILI